MIMRAVTVMGVIASMALASTTFAECFKCASPSGPCVTCGNVPGNTAGCEVFPNGICVDYFDGDPCTLPGCGGGGDVCMEPEICPIEIQGVILGPGDSGPSLPADRRGFRRTVSGLRGLSFAEVLNRIRAESPDWTGLQLEGWHYAVGRERIRSGLVADDGSGYALAARRTPAGTHVAVYSPSSGKSFQTVSTSMLSPDEVLVFEQSIRGRTHLVVIGARGPGSGPAGSDLRARQDDFFSALAALPHPQGGLMRRLSASEAAAIPD